MSESTGIEWCDSTFNPWVGCTKISPACDHCYAEGWAKRSGMVKWGNEPRRRTSAANWREPLKWQATATEFERQHGHRRRVFCASLADVFDNQVPEEWRQDLWSLIERCPGMDWLLLTKRPQNIEKMLPDPVTWGRIKGHVWLGTTVEDQERDRNLLHLLKHDAAVRFVSYEPALGSLDVSWAMANRLDLAARYLERGMFAPGLETLHPLDWVIAGGESGHHARPPHPDWFRSLRDQCSAASVPFLFKQWGAWAPFAEDVYVASGIATVMPDGRVREWQPDYPTSRLTSPQQQIMDEVGKKAAGRLLDGVEHNGFPVTDQARAAA